MEINLANRMASIWKNRLSIGALALGISLCALPAAAQQDQQQNQQQQQDQQQQQGQQQDQQQQPQDQSQQNQVPQPPPADQQQAPQSNDQQAQPQAEAPLPDSLALAPGTVVQVRTSEWLSSDRNKVGDQVILTLDQPLVVDGWVVARRGQTVVGTVTEALKAGRVKGVSRLGLSLSQLTLVDGQLVDVKSQLMHATAGPSKGRDAAAIAGTTGFGAAVGAAAAGGPGAAIGAGAGFVASIAGVLVTRGKPTIFPPETLLTFKLEAPIAISTARGQMAFHAVTPQDYATRTATRNRMRRPSPYYGYGYPASPYGGYYYYPYPSAYGFGFYPAPVYFGYYGGWYGRRWR